jgi:hypothetical protein
MPTMPTVSNGIFSDLTRALRLSVIAVPVSVITVVVVAWANPAATGDEIATIAAVPLLISYLMIRGIMWLDSATPNPTEEEMRAFERSHAPAFSVEVSATLGLVFVLGMGWVAVGTLSALAYWALGLPHAFAATLSSVKWTLFIAAMAAVIICLMMLCKSWLLKIARASHLLFNDPTSFFHGRA